MRNRQIWLTTLALIRRHPYFWLIALVAAAGDLSAALAYDPHSTRLTIIMLLSVLVALLAEAALIYAFSQHLLNKPCNFLDSVMASITSLFTLLIVKALPMILLAGLALLSLLFYSLLLGFLDWLASPIVTAAVIALLAISGLLLLVWTQIWTVFALRVVLTGNATDFISEAWDAFWHSKMQLTALVLPLVLADLLLLGALWTIGGVTSESIFEYTVTKELAAGRSVVGGVEEAGTYTSINRVFNALLTTTFKGRGADLASLSLLVIKSKIVAIIVTLVGWLLLPLRVGLLTTAVVTSDSAHLLVMKSHNQ